MPSTRGGAAREAARQLLRGWAAGPGSGGAGSLSGLLKQLKSEGVLVAPAALQSRCRADTQPERAYEFAVQVHLRLLCASGGTGESDTGERATTSRPALVPVQDPAPKKLIKELIKLIGVISFDMGVVADGEFNQWMEKDLAPAYRSVLPQTMRALLSKYNLLENDNETTQVMAPASQPQAEVAPAAPQPATLSTRARQLLPKRTVSAAVRRRRRGTPERPDEKLMLADSGSAGPSVAMRQESAASTQHRARKRRLTDASSAGGSSSASGSSGDGRGGGSGGGSDGRERRERRRIYSSPAERARRQRQIGEMMAMAGSGSSLGGGGGGCSPRLPGGTSRRTQPPGRLDNQLRGGTASTSLCARAAQQGHGQRTKAPGLPLRPSPQPTVAPTKFSMMPWRLKKAMERGAAIAVGTRRGRGGKTQCRTVGRLDNTTTRVREGKQPRCTSVAAAAAASTAAEGRHREEGLQLSRRRRADSESSVANHGAAAKTSSHAPPQSRVLDLPPRSPLVSRSAGLAIADTSSSILIAESPLRAGPSAVAKPLTSHDGHCWAAPKSPLFSTNGSNDHVILVAESPLL
eukprot:COSAG01_NODE_1087_length_11791_cov_7.666182_6_plen_577_part_00